MQLGARWTCSRPTSLLADLSNARPELVGIRPSTVKPHLADLRARSGLTTVQLIYTGRTGGGLLVRDLEPGLTGQRMV